MNKSEYNRVLALTEERANTIRQQVNAGCSEIIDHVHVAADAFYSGIVAKVPTWVNSAHSKKSVNNILKIKKQSTVYTEELVGIIQQNLEAETQIWLKGHLGPLVTTDITALADTFNADTTSCFEQLRRLRLTLDVNQRKVVDAATPSAANRFLSSGVSLLIGDWGGAIMGGFGGWDAMKKTLICEFGAGVILGIIALFNPIGLTAIIVSMIISAIVGGTWAMEAIEGKIRTKVKEEMVKNLRSIGQRNKFKEMIDKHINKYLDCIRTDVEGRLKLLNATTDAFKLVTVD